MAIINKHGFAIDQILNVDKPLNGTTKIDLSDINLADTSGQVVLVIESAETKTLVGTVDLKIGDGTTTLPLTRIAATTVCTAGKIMLFVAIPTVMLPNMRIAKAEMVSSSASDTGKINAYTIVQ